MQPEDNSVLYLILAVFQLSIVSMCLIQNELNEMAIPVNPTATAQ